MNQLPSPQRTHAFCAAATGKQLFIDAKPYAPHATGQIVNAAETGGTDSAFQTLPHQTLPHQTLPSSHPQAVIDGGLINQPANKQTNWDH